MDGGASCDDMKLENRFRKIYKVLGAGMILAPVTALLITVIFRRLHAYVFIAEATAIAVFVGYWWIKSIELSRTKAELNALLGQIRTLVYMKS